MGSSPFTRTKTCLAIARRFSFSGEGTSSAHVKSLPSGEGLGVRRRRSPAGSIASLRSPPIQLWPGFRDSGEGTSQVRARSVPGPQIVGGPATAYALRGRFASRVIGLFADLRQCPASPATAPDSTGDGARHHLRRQKVLSATVFRPCHGLTDHFHYLRSMADYYRHFKGGKYKLLGIAKDSETLEKMVVYQALYGEGEM